MKITLPESIADITLGKSQRFDELNKRFVDDEITIREYNKRKITLFSGIPFHKVEDVSHKDLEEVMLQIDTAMGVTPEFVSAFELRGKEFGFIPNLDQITAGEYFDLNKYGVESETLHNLMAILFRPITKKDKFGNYDIEVYNGTAEYAELMKQTPMHIVNGALVFFLNLSKELKSFILKYTVMEQEKDKKRQTTLLNGIGTVPSMN